MGQKGPGGQQPWKTQPGCQQWQWTVVKGGVGITQELPGLLRALLVPTKWETSARAAAKYSSTSVVSTLQIRPGL